MSDERASLVLDTVPSLLAYVDAEQRYQLTNSAFRAWFDGIFGDVRGRTLADVLGPAAFELIRPHVEAALRGQPVAFESRVPHARGTRWVHSDYVPHRDGEGRVIGFVSQVHDITDRKVAEERLALLADVSRALGTARDREAALRAVEEGVVPGCADWLVVWLVRDGGELERAHLAHVGYVARGEVEQLAAALAMPGDPDSAVARAIASRERVVIADGAARAPRTRLAGAPIAIAPLVARGRALGAMAVGSARHVYDANDLSLLDEIGRRAGAALDTAALFEAQAKSHEQLAEAMRRLSLADRSKDEFLAMLGHELRNPLAPITIALDLLDRRAPPGTQRERDIIRRHARHLAHLLDDLMDVSRIAQGKLRLSIRPVALADVIERAVESTAAHITERRHQLLIDVAPDLVVEGDPVRLVQIVANLLVNAAKYTQPAGRIAVIAARDGARVRITVEDNGPGIAPDLLPDVFDPFVQSPQTIERAEGGLGLGLAVVRSLTQLHGGNVQVQSDGIGRGARFTVELRASALESTGTARREVRARVTPRGPVLVVDDNVDAAVLLADALHERGFSVAVAHDAPAAMTIAGRLRPAYALLDLGLPVIDGYELARRLRGQLADPALRLVAITGYIQPHDFARSREAGFHAHLGKPVDIDAIVDALS